MSQCSDEVGLGKTLEMLLLILANPPPVRRCHLWGTEESI